jgi:hypothetical protein
MAAGAQQLVRSCKTCFPSSDSDERPIKVFARIKPENSLAKIAARLSVGERQTV